MTKLPPPEGYLFSKAYTGYVFLLLWLLYFFDYIDRMVVVSLFPFSEGRLGADRRPVRGDGLRRILGHHHLLLPRLHRDRPLEPEEEHRHHGRTVERGHGRLRGNEEFRPAFRGPGRHRPGGSRLCARRDGDDLRPLSRKQTRPHGGYLERLHSSRNGGRHRHRGGHRLPVGMAPRLRDRRPPRPAHCTALLFRKGLQDGRPGKNGRPIGGRTRRRPGRRKKCPTGRSSARSPERLPFF